MLGIFLDTETIGRNPQKHRVIEIAFRIIDVLSGEEKDSFHSLVTMSTEEWKKSDPESLQFNGFKWEEVVKGVSAAEVGQQIQALFVRHKIKRGEAAFICQNPSFDRVFFSQLVDPDRQEALLWPYHWLDLASMYWTEAIKSGKHPWKNGFSKDKIAKAYHLPPEAQPHRAMNGVDHLLLCYRSVVGFPQSANNS